MNKNTNLDQMSYTRIKSLGERSNKLAFCGVSKYHYIPLTKTYQKYFYTSKNIFFQNMKLTMYVVIQSSKT